MSKETCWVVCVVVNNLGELLLLKRSPKKKLFPNKWAIVGGGPLKEDVDMQAAVCRELKEELGTEFVIEKRGDEFRFVVQQGNMKTRVSPFLARVVSKEIVLNKEHTEYTWVKLEDLKKYDFVPGMSIIIQKMIS